MNDDDWQRSLPQVVCSSASLHQTRTIDDSFPLLLLFPCFVLIWTEVHTCLGKAYLHRMFIGSSPLHDVTTPSLWSSPTTSTAQRPNSKYARVHMELRSMDRATRQVCLRSNTGKLQPYAPGSPCPGYPRRWLESLDLAKLQCTVRREDAGTDPILLSPRASLPSFQHVPRSIRIRRGGCSAVMIR